MPQTSPNDRRMSPNDVNTSPNDVSTSQNYVHMSPSHRMTCERPQTWNTSLNFLTCPTWRWSYKVCWHFPLNLSQTFLTFRRVAVYKMEHYARKNSCILCLLGIWCLKCKNEIEDPIEFFSILFSEPNFAKTSVEAEIANSIPAH